VQEQLGDSHGPVESGVTAAVVGGDAVAIFQSSTSNPSSTP